MKAVYDSFDLQLARRTESREKEAICRQERLLREDELQEISYLQRRHTTVDYHWDTIVYQYKRSRMEQMNVILTTTSTNVLNMP
eukprot:5615121-Amphidinium_carterae.1